MGEIFGIKCSNCEYKFSAVIGHGILGSRFFETNNSASKPYY